MPVLLTTLTTYHLPLTTYHLPLTTCYLLLTMATLTMAQVDKLECQYSYEDGDDMVFLNMESFEEVHLLWLYPPWPHLTMAAPYYGCTHYGCTHYGRTYYDCTHYDCT